MDDRDIMTQSTAPERLEAVREIMNIDTAQAGQTDSPIETGNARSGTMLKAATLITATAIIAQAARVSIGKDIGMTTTAIPTIGLAPEIA